MSEESEENGEGCYNIFRSIIAECLLIVSAKLVIIEGLTIYRLEDVARCDLL